MTTIRGKRIYLRAMECDDLIFLNTLHNDPVINEKTGGNRYLVSTEYDKKWLENKMFNTREQLYLMVCKVEDGAPIGYAGFTDIDHWNKKCFNSSITISTEYGGRGFGIETTELLIKYAFEEMGMNRIQTAYLDDNDASFHIGQKLGFVLEGVHRDFVFKTGRYHSMRFCSLLRSEYEALKEEGGYSYI